jgi:hypothetical protein
MGDSGLPAHGSIRCPLPSPPLPSPVGCRRWTPHVVTSLRNLRSWNSCHANAMAPGARAHGTRLGAAPLARPTTHQGRACVGVPHRPGWPAMSWPTIDWSKWCKCSCLLTWFNRAELNCGCVCLACTDGYNNHKLECSDNTSSFHLLSLPSLTSLSLLSSSLP